MKGTVHDLGYKRYVGTRRPQGTRWQVIARNVRSQAWKGFWKFKLPLLGAVATTVVVAVFMTNDLIVGGMSRIFMGSPEELLIYLSYTWFSRCCFIASMLIAAGAIANDAATGAFSFYFARPVRPADYVLGKLVGLWLMFSVIMVGGPLILAGIRLGMYGDGGDALANADILLRVIVVGSLGALVFAAVPLAVSALAPTRRHALALWATYYLIIGSIAYLMDLKGTPVVGLLDPRTAVDAAAYGMLDIKVRTTARAIIPLPVALGGMAAYAAAAIAIVYVKVRQGRSSGIGGG